LKNQLESDAVSHHAFKLHSHLYVLLTGDSQLSSISSLQLARKNMQMKARAAYLTFCFKK